MKKYCEHCYPIPAHPWHIMDRLEAAFLRLTYPIELLNRRFPRPLNFLQKKIISALLILLERVGILREHELTHQERIPNRTWVVIEEAKKRGTRITSLKFLSQPSNFYRYYHLKGKPFIFEVLPTVLAHTDFAAKYDDKEILRQLLKEKNLPHPEGRVFRSVKKALAYGEQLGYPLIVKPRSGSLSKHTTTKITNRQKLEKAVRIAKKISPEFVVEQHIEGNVHRVTLVNGEIVAAALRLPPHVISDSNHTIKELIKIKNSQHNRQHPSNTTSTLHTMLITEQTDNFLRTQSLTLSSVPAEGVTVWLHDKLMLATGADIHDCTDDLHPDNVQMFKKAYEVCKIPLVGFDFISPNISVSYRTQTCAIIEANTLPYIDMHHFPVKGEPRNVAAKILDYVENSNFNQFA